MLNRLFFCWFFVFLCSCSFYTVKNNFNEKITVGLTVIEPDQCAEFLDLFMVGDFPLQFKYQNGNAIDSKNYSAAHYTVSKDAEIKKRNFACKKYKVGKNKIRDEKSSVKNQENEKTVKTTPPVDQNKEDVYDFDILMP